MKYINTQDLANHWPLYDFADNTGTFCPIMQKERIPYFRTFDDYHHKFCRYYDYVWNLLCQGSVRRGSHHKVIEKECEVMYLICLRPADKDKFELWKKQKGVKEEDDSDCLFCYGCTSDLAVAQQIAEFNYRCGIITKFFPFETQKTAEEQRLENFYSEEGPLYTKSWTYPDDNQNQEKQR